MSDRFQNEAAVQLLASQFVLLRIKTDDEDKTTWREWTKKYKFDGNGIPLIFVVRADGEQLYGKSGTPDALVGFLSQALKQSGRLLNSRDLSRIQKGVADAKKQMEAGDVEFAVSRLLKIIGSGSFAAPAVAADQLANELADNGQMAIEVAVEKLANEPDRVEGIIELAAAKRQFGNLPVLKDSFADALEKLRKLDGGRQLLSQAETLERARAAAMRRKTKQARSLYRKIVDRPADSVIGGLAKAELEKLGDSTGSTSTTTTKPTPNSEKRAVAKLRLAKLLLKKKPKKAREYLEEVIKLSPESMAAKEAKELLEGL